MSCKTYSSKILTKNSVETEYGKKLELVEDNQLAIFQLYVKEVNSVNETGRRNRMVKQLPKPLH